MRTGVGHDFFAAHEASNHVGFVCDWQAGVDKGEVRKSSRHLDRLISLLGGLGFEALSTASDRDLEGVWTTVPLHSLRRQ